MLFFETILPYQGTESIKLYQTIDVVKGFFSENRICYREERWSSEAETVSNPWNVLVIDGTLSLFFASNGKLFKMVFWENYSGALLNGIHTGMSIDDAQAIDSTLMFDDWNEDYESSDGYWLEDDPDTGEIISISVFIREVLDEDTFDYCKW